jgi:hypothetical protein
MAAARRRCCSAARRCRCSWCALMLLLLLLMLAVAAAAAADDDACLFCSPCGGAARVRGGGVNERIAIAMIASDRVRMRVKSIKRSATVAWSPVPGPQSLLALGSAAAALDDAFSSSANLEIFSCGLDNSSQDMKVPCVCEPCIPSPHPPTPPLLLFLPPCSYSDTSMLEIASSG